MKIRGKDFKLHKKTDNKGSAMVVVIIAMAFIGILASVLMYMSLLNYQMKANNLQAKDNFYSAETVLDEIRVHMESRYRPLWAQHTHRSSKITTTLRWQRRRASFGTPF